MYFIKEIFKDREGNTFCAITVGQFQEERDRDEAFDRHIMGKGRMGLRT